MKPILFVISLPQEQKQLCLKKVDSVIDQLSHHDTIAEALLRVFLVLNVPVPFLRSESTGK